MYELCSDCGHPLHKLSDWVNGQPDAWDYMKVLKDNDVFMGFATGDGWSLEWKPGVMYIGQVDRDLAHKAAALFIELWTRGVSAPFADKLMNAYIYWEEAS